MKKIKREEIPKSCKWCGANLKSYHNPGITRLICSKQCRGFEVVVEIDHDLEWKGDESAIKLHDSYGQGFY